SLPHVLFLVNFQPRTRRAAPVCRPPDLSHGRCCSAGHAVTGERSRELSRRIAHKGEAHGEAHLLAVHLSVRHRQVTKLARYVAGEGVAVVREAHGTRERTLLAYDLHVPAARSIARRRSAGRAGTSRPGCRPCRRTHASLEHTLHEG